MAYQDLEFRRNLWEQFGIGLQSLTEQWSKRKMSEEKKVIITEVLNENDDVELYKFMQKGDAFDVYYFNKDFWDFIDNVGINTMKDYKKRASNVYEKCELI